MANEKSLEEKLASAQQTIHAKSQEIETLRARIASNDPEVPLSEAATEIASLRKALAEANTRASHAEEQAKAAGAFNLGKRVKVFLSDVIDKEFATDKDGLPMLHTEAERAIGLPRFKGERTVVRHKRGTPVPFTDAQLKELGWHENQVWGWR